MYNTKKAKGPASWADSNPNHANGTNGHIDGLENGHANGHTNETNGHNGRQNVPSSFLEGKAVRTVYGLVPLKFALDWPVFASYDELTGCAAWLGGRIPTFEEARSIYTYVNNIKREEAERQLGSTVPAVNG